MITVDNLEIDPYFILDVTEKDDEKFITKSFRKKAKIWHPDRISLKDSKDLEIVKNVNHHFKILVESYEYIINKKKSFLNSNKETTINISKSNNIQTKSIDNLDELHLFNGEFDKNHISTPNDFGYGDGYKRLADENEYDNFNYKPYQLFDTKKFNNEDFNKAFEYQQKSHLNQNEVSLYNTTNDGFNPYNGSDLSGSANVSSYNGIMIIGDTYGQTGVGYYDSSYSDYKKSFDCPKNPERSIKIPKDFIESNKTNEKINKKESNKQIELQIKYRNTPVRSSKENFKLQENILLEKQKNDINKKERDDKDIIFKFKDMYSDKKMINDAFNNRQLN